MSALSVRNELESADTIQEMCVLCVDNVARSVSYALRRKKLETKHHLAIYLSDYLAVQHHSSLTFTTASKQQSFYCFCQFCLSQAKTCGWRRLLFCCLCFFKWDWLECSLRILQMKRKFTNFMSRLTLSSILETL